MKTNTRPAFFVRARQRIIEELATQRILHGMTYEDGIMIPPSWEQEIQAVERDILQLVEAESEKERR